MKGRDSATENTLKRPERAEVRWRLLWPPFQRYSTNRNFPVAKLHCPSNTVIGAFRYQTPTYLPILQLDLRLLPV